MSKDEHAFWQACLQGDLDEVKVLASRVDVNWMNIAHPESTGLMIACFKGHEHVVEFLLSLGRLNVNAQTYDGLTALHLACHHKDARIVRRLAMDIRVDLNKIGMVGGCPLWYAAFWGNYDAIRYLLGAGPHLHTGQRTRWSKNTPEETARTGVLASTGSADLIAEYTVDPQKVSQRLRRELNWPTRASSVFALTIFLCDGLLKLSGKREPSPAERFFSIASRLHLDLQLLLANRSQGLATNHVPAADRELAFTSLAKVFLIN